jgi:hypothetical protein
MQVMTDSKTRGPPPRKSTDPPVPPHPGVMGGTGRFERLVPPRDRSRLQLPARHSAITRNLQNYASYKSWAEKMRISWDSDKEPDA